MLRQDKVGLLGWAIEKCIQHAQMERRDRRSLRDLTPGDFQAAWILYGDEIEAQEPTQEQIARAAAMASSDDRVAALGDGTILAKILAWIENGGLEKLIKLIMDAIAIFGAFSFRSSRSPQPQPSGRITDTVTGDFVPER